MSECVAECVVVRHLKPKNFEWEIVWQVIICNADFAHSIAHCAPNLWSVTVR